jgi:hypothetical protein
MLGKAQGLQMLHNCWNTDSFAALKHALKRLHGSTCRLIGMVKLKPDEAIARP